MLINAWREFSGANHAAKHCDLLKSSVGIGFKTSNVTKGIRWIPGLGRVIGALVHVYGVGHYGSYCEVYAASYTFTECRRWL